MDALDYLAQDNYIIVNKTLISEIGLENAVMLGAMCGYQRYFKNDFFYREQNKMIEDTGLTEYSVRKSIKELVEMEYLIAEKKGMPAKVYYKVNLLKFEIRSSRSIENDTSRGCENETSNNIYINNNINTNKNINKNKEKYKKENLEAILDYWNSKNIIKHKSSTDILETINTALKTNTDEEIKLAIDHYKEVLDSNYFFSYKWSLVDFLKRKSGYKSFLNDGSNWVNYLEWKNNPNPKPKYNNSNQVQPKELSEFEKNWFKEQDEKFWGKKQ